MSTTAVETLKKFLSEHNANEIETATNNESSNIVELQATLSPINAATILWKNNIVGAPVWDDGIKKYIGFFEMRDIVSALLANAKAEKVIASYEDRYDEPNVKAIPELLSSSTSSTNGSGNNHKTKFAVVRPNEKTISYLAARNHFTYCKADATLIEVCECLNKENIHRVPIVNEDTNKCQNIISQSALIKFISKHCPNLDQSIMDAGIPYRKKVVMIQDDAPASEAFTLLDNKRLSGIAVVDEDGKLVGNTSARDIKLAAMDEGKTAIDMDILSYLAKVRQAVPQKKEKYPCCHIHEDVTVGHVINVLAKTGYHRVFVVDENMHPIGVMSVTDIASMIC